MEFKEEKVMVKEVKKAQNILLKVIVNIQLAVYLLLMLLLTCLVLLMVYEYTLYIYELLTTTKEGLEFDHILGAISSFLIILIGLELMDTIKSFIVTHKVNVNIFITLALIAVCRKLIVIDLVEADDMDLIGLGVIIIALAGGYYLFRKTDLATAKDKNKDKDKLPPQESTE